MGRLQADPCLVEDGCSQKRHATPFRCWPPPLFTVSITLLELGFFIYYATAASAEDPVPHTASPASQLTPPLRTSADSLSSPHPVPFAGSSLLPSPFSNLSTVQASLGASRLGFGASHLGVVPLDSVLLYRPDRRRELWRFLTYMVLHASWWHLLVNLLVQLSVGLPLELVHGSARVLLVYLAGVLAGSLGTSVCDTSHQVYLVGASGGVYALLTAHIADVILNYRHMELGPARVLAVLLIAGGDVGFALYRHWAPPLPLAAPSLERPVNYSAPLTAPSMEPAVSYAAHLAAAGAGLTLGLAVLRSFAPKSPDSLLRWTAGSTWLVCTAFAVVLNVLPPPGDYYA